jgi:hypothetical protein
MVLSSLLPTELLKDMYINANLLENANRTIPHDKLTPFRTFVCQNNSQKVDINVKGILKRLYRLESG